jgi:hypothetical protein
MSDACGRDPAVFFLQIAYVSRSLWSISLEAMTHS